MGTSPTSHATNDKNRKESTITSLGKYVSARRSFFFMIVGLAVFFFYLYFYIGFSQMFHVLEQLNYSHFLFFYLLAIIATLFSLLFSSASWAKLLNTLSIKISLAKAFQYNMVGNFVDLVVPCQTVCGEVVRVQLVYQEKRENYGRIFSSALVNRILFNIIYVFGLSVGAFVILLNRSSLPGFLIGPLLVFVIGALIYNTVLITMAVRRGTAKKLFSGLISFLEVISFGHFDKKKLMARAEKPLINFETGFQAYRENPKSLIMPSVLISFSWLLGVLSFVLVFFALGYFYLPVDFFLIGFSLTISIQGIVATLSVGALDIFLTQFLNLYAHTTLTIGASSVAVLLLRFVVFWLQIIVGWAIIQFVGARVLLSASPSQPKK